MKNIIALLAFAVALCASAANGSLVIDVTPFAIYLEPGQTLTFAVTGDTSGAPGSC